LIALIAVAVGLLLLPVSALDGPNELAATGDPILIGMPAITLQQEFHAALKNEAEKAAAQLGARLVVLDSQGSPGKQSDDIGNLVATGVRGIVMSPMSRGVVAAIEAAVNAGVPVATVDTKADTDKVLVHVGIDNVEAGRMAARFVIDRLGNKGSVIEFEGAPLWPTAVDRKAGFDEVIGKSNVKLLTSLTAYWSRPRAGEQMEALMRAYPDFDAVFAANDDMILGAITAMQLAKVDPASKVTVGVDATPEALRYLKEGKLSATIDGLPGKQARLAVEYLVGYIKNQTKPAQKVVLIKPELVTEAR
jgi:ribose transport system substrate-binding protein